MEVQNLVWALKQLNGHDDYGLSWTGIGLGLGANLVDRRETPLSLISRLMLRMMKGAGYDAATIIPVPSTTHTRPSGEFVPRRLAAAVQLRDPNFTAIPALYFARSVPRTAASRRRTETALRVNLRATDLGTGLGRVILVDDVMATGAHLRATASFLSDRGIRVEDAFVVSRLADHCPDSMFEVPVIDI